MSEPMLRLLGGIEWPRPDAAALPSLGRKPRALLALAAANGQRGLSREQLSALLWPELDPGAGAAALRQCLHLLRRTLGEFATVIDARRDRIGLRAQHVDLFAFEALAGRDDLESLSAAARLYRGEFCEGLLAAEDEVAREIDSERARLRQLAHRVAARMASIAKDKAAIELAIGLARRLLARDPLHEACLRTLMELLALGGLRAEALGAYAGFCETLRRELAIEPSAETAAVAQRLRASVPPATTGGLLFPAAAVPAAVDQIVRAWSLLRRPSPENMRLAREGAEAALRIDRNYSTALVVQGWTHWVDWVLGWSETPNQTWARAVELTDRALAIEGDKAQAQMLRAAILVWERRHDEALELVLAATRTAPYFAHAHHQLANVLMFRGQPAEALQHFRRARELDAEDMGGFLQAEAVAHFMLGELTEARQLIERAITRNPTSPWAHLCAVAIYSDLGALDLARAEARVVAELCPRWRYGVFRAQRDRERFAAAWARIGLAPEAERGQPPGAANGGVPIVAGLLMFPTDALAAAADHLLRAVLLMRQFTPESIHQARDAAEIAARIDAHYAEALICQGWTHLWDWLFGWSESPDESRRLSRALAQRALSIHRDRAPPHLLQAGLLLWEMKHEEAFAHAEIALRIAPDYSGSRHHRANVLVYSGRHAEGLDDIRRAIGLEPNENGVCLTVQARALYLLGDLIAARESIERAITRNPAYPFARLVAVAIQSDLGNYEAARAEADAVERLCPNRVSAPFLLASDRARVANAFARVGLGLGRAPSAKIVSVVRGNAARRRANE